eukprot:243608_1
MPPDPRQTVAHCLRELLIISYITIYISANPCIDSYPGHTIDYITNNIGNDSFIYYLGKKSSTNECQQSCVHLNYLCDTSADDLIGDLTSTVSFDPDNCEITASLGDASLLLTSDLISKEYIIDAQVTPTEINDEIGIFFKTDIRENTEIDYFFHIDLDSNEVVTGYETSPSDYSALSTDALSLTFAANIPYNLTVHVIGTQFTTYLNGEVHYADPTYHIDESTFQFSYVGVYVWHADAILHSLKIRFPDATDNQDEKVCAAYQFDKTSGTCYGYYGNDYAAIESSLAPNAQHDSSIFYDSTCEPSTAPFDPTPSRTRYPSASPSQPPIVETPNPTATPSQSHAATPNPTSTPSNSRYPTVSPTRYPSTMPTVFPSYNPPFNHFNVTLSPLSINPTINVYTNTSTNIINANVNNDLDTTSAMNIISTLTLDTPHDLVGYIALSVVLCVLCGIIMCIALRCGCSNEGRRKSIPNEVREKSESLQQPISTIDDVINEDDFERNDRNSIAFNSNVVMAPVVERNEGELAVGETKGCELELIDNRYVGENNIMIDHVADDNDDDDEILKVVNNTIGMMQVQEDPDDAGTRGYIGGSL